MEVNAVLLVLYLGLPALAWWRTRSLAWVVLSLAAAWAVTGSLISGLVDLGMGFNRTVLQFVVLAVLVAVVLISWIRPFRGAVPMSRQAIAVLAPIGLLLAALALITVVWTDGLAFLRPVGFLMGHATAEDNSRWLDFTAQWASGEVISQPVPTGGPLQLYMTLVGTAMAVYSETVLGGFNEVAIAANSVIFGEFFLVALMPLALAVLAETSFVAPTKSRGMVRASGFIPSPIVWTGSAILSIGALAVIAFGHLTLQFVLVVLGLWVATFLAQSPIPRARVVASAAAAAMMTVWVPLTIVAVAIFVGWITTYARRGWQRGVRAVDWIGVTILCIVALGLIQPLLSALTYVAFDSTASANVTLAGGVSSGVGFPALSTSVLFSAEGGTEQAGPILVSLALVAAITAALVVSRQSSMRPSRAYRAFAPLGLLAVIAVGIFVLDSWGSSNGPNYGSLKFAFMVVIIAIAACLPIGLLLLDGSEVAGMTPSRWVAVVGVVLVLSVDTLLPRAISEARPQVWSPPIPFDNTSGSYWYPAEVNGAPNQAITANPIACLYLPEGYSAPTAIVPSGLSDPQRVYACTRQLAGLGGLDTQAQDVVAWLRREWLTNTPAWSDVYDGLSGLPAEVLDRPVILLDDGSNVKGIETLRSLLTRFPKDAAQAR